MSGLCVATMNWMLGTNKAHAQCGGRDRIAIDTIKNTSRVMLLIHEGRDTIDDGCNYWSPDTTARNMPSHVHYNGTTLVYLDGHARWRSYNALVQEFKDGWWDPTL